jgi:predicted NACHT family NTPase
LDGGFLHNPESKWGKIYNPNTKPIEEFLSNPCLILLGEPGLGKSFEVELNKPLFCGAGSINEKTLIVNLNTCMTDIQLERKILYNPKFEAWRSCDQDTLYLTLESLDECLIRVEILINILLEILKGSPIERLYLRIVCRTGYWPAALEVGLKELWGQESVKIIELMPLRRVDVENAARMESVDFEAFMTNIISRDISSFAARPITLRFLLKRFKATGELPENQIEMYNEGCLMLCEEGNPLRINTTAAGTLCSKARLIIASRIAASLIFSGKTTIWNTIDSGDVPNEAMPIGKLIGFDQMDGQPLLVDERAILETLTTGLFSSRGQNLLGWAHQTYGEYLAANYLRIHSVQEKKIMSLISVGRAEEKGIIPQLFPVTAWIAGMIPTIFRQIMMCEPEILLFGDITAMSDSLKAEFVGIYLKQLDNEGVIDWELRRNFRYDRIKHSGIEEQIRGYITSREKNDTVRSEAIHIAEQCRLRELSNIFCGLALDETESLVVRIDAARAVSRIGENDDKVGLKVLAVQANKDDGLDQLKGYGLMAVWPNYITAEELFSSLTPPKRGSFSGSYSYFISEHLLPGLNNLDIPIALHWVLSQADEDGRSRSHGRFEELPDKILRLGWENLYLSGVIEKLALIILRKIRSYKEILGEVDGESYRFSEEDTGKRRRLLEYLIDNFEPSQKLAQEVCGTALVCVEDIDWILGKLTLDMLPGNVAQVWAYILDTLWYWAGNPLEITKQIYLIYQSTPELAAIFESAFSAVELSSISAQQSKEYYYQRKKWEERESKTKEDTKVDIVADVNLLVEQFENGHADAWWRLTYALTFDESGTQKKDEYTSDIMVLPGWMILDSAVQTKVIEIAERYLLEQRPEPEKWVRSARFYAPDIAGFKAIQLLYLLAPERLQSVPIGVWGKWASVIVCYPEWADGENEKNHQELVKLAYMNAPAEVIKYMSILIDKENRQSGCLNRLDKFDCIWDDALAAMLLTKARSIKLKPEALWCLMQKLIVINYEPAFTYARNILKYRRDKEKAIVLAKFILNSNYESAWDLIWNIISRDENFGKSLLLRIGSHWENTISNLLPKMDEEELADLYLWIVKHFPFEEDPKHEGVFSPTARDDIIHVRSGVLEHLKMRGSVRSILAISRILRTLPEQDGLIITLKRAKKVRREKTWVPPTPEEVLFLIKDSKSRLVKNGDHLLEALIDALNNIQDKLKGETPLEFVLWDRVNAHKYRPKSENDFSDFIKVLLEYELANRGIILNREVEIRRNRGGEPGQRTDIHVEAVSTVDTHDIVRVIIEAKGCWHEELDTAMSNQLVGCYLQKNECRHGLYLVGWFNCEQWDANDKSRRRQAYKHDFASLVKKMEDQAKGLSINGISVKAIVMDASLR